MTPTFTVPSYVNANSAGTATASAATTYAWTIANGSFTSATNIQTITFTAGPTGQVILGVTVTNGTICSSNSGTSIPINRLPVASIASDRGIDTPLIERYHTLYQCQVPLDHLMLLHLLQ